MDDRLPARHLIYIIPLAILGAFVCMAFIGNANDTVGAYHEQRDHNPRHIEANF